MHFSHKDSASERHSGDDSRLHRLRTLYDILEISHPQTGTGWHSSHEEQRPDDEKQVCPIPGADTGMGNEPS